MESCRLIALYVFICLVSCGSKDSSSNKDFEGTVKTSTVDKDQSNRVDLYDGLYLNNWNNSGVLLIYEGKIHHFSRQQFNSIYKDEEYDFSSIEDGHLLMNRTYRLDRNEDVVSKETILKDIQPIVENGRTIALERNGRTFERMGNFGLFLSRFNWNLEQVAEKYSKTWNVDVLQIKRALSNSQFYKTPFLTDRVLRDGEIAFEDVLRGLVNSTEPN